MKTKENRIDEFVATLDSSNEMSKKQFVSLSGAGLADSGLEAADKNKHNDRCCNTEESPETN